MQKNKADSRQQGNRSHTDVCFRSSGARVHTQPHTNTPTHIKRELQCGFCSIDFQHNCFQALIIHPNNVAECQTINAGGKKELEGEKYCPADESTTCTGKGQTVLELFWFLFLLKVQCILWISFMPKVIILISVSHS